MTEAAAGAKPGQRPGNRRAARRAALQAIYQWLLADTDTGELLLQFERDGTLRGADGDYFRTLVRGVLADPDGLEAEVVGYLDRRVEHLDPVERAVLLVAVYELRERIEIPFRVVLNEALELAKRYGAEAGHRYINGVLDRAAAALRPQETGPRR